MKQYRCISIDPPWPERGGGKIKRGADRHYPVLKSPADIIKVIYQAELWSPAEDGAHCWLWVTNNYLEDGLFILKALGFRYINKITWGKVRNGNVQKGLGQYFFGADELCLFGVRGRLKANERVPTFFMAERGKHSAKPSEAYLMMEKVSPGPRLEMFARKERAGWDVWGNEVGS